MINRRTNLPSRWALLFLAGCCALSMVITFRAGAAQKAAATPPAATAPAKADAPADTQTDSKAEPAGKRPPPSRPEESATIPDDPTLVPDDKESADNNVTFPVDI